MTGLESFCLRSRPNYSGVLHSKGLKDPLDKQRTYSTANGFITKIVNSLFCILLIFFSKFNIELILAVLQRKAN